MRMRLLCARATGEKNTLNNRTGRYGYSRRIHQLTKGRPDQLRRAFSFFLSVLQFVAHWKAAQGVAIRIRVAIITSAVLPPAECHKLTPRN